MDCEQYLQELHKYTRIAKGADNNRITPDLEEFIASIDKPYEWHDDSGSWYRACGNENWEFAENGLMMRRFASINDVPILESERKFRWERPSTVLLP